jgi:transcription initiation factor TFIIF subunit alpha
MADASLFLRKRKDKQRQRVPTAHLAPPLGPSGSNPTSPRPVSGLSPVGLQAQSSNKPSPTTGTPGSSAHITEIKLFSPHQPSDHQVRYNILKLNTSKPTDPRHIHPPILLNRKTPGPRQPPVYAFDDEGKPIGKYLYQPDGKPILDENGQQAIERRVEMDMSLVGTAPGQGEKKKGRRGVREVYHQDREVIRLRREEAEPWVLESGSPSQDGASGSTSIPDHWVGRMVEPSNMPTVLLVNEGENAGFTIRSLGRTYRFDPERPFKVLDPEAAHKLVSSYIFIWVVPDRY